ncbi:hypothetical protein K2173_011010 [Erythroxylum novogranatense]|uniref:C2H2-type domain-containing protein n=1 Tax=Erythroxylum novogranatense TaxID=1862640 RepID=A0AAV8T218_9ROSI|nr:hypothetical protein K2173_011010 [Erythroxylum novogranatense]
MADLRRSNLNLISFSSNQPANDPQAPLLSQFFHGDQQNMRNLQIGMCAHGFHNYGQISLSQRINELRRSYGGPNRTQGFVNDPLRLQTNRQANDNVPVGEVIVTELVRTTQLLNGNSTMNNLLSRHEPFTRDPQFTDRPALPWSSPSQTANDNNINHGGVASPTSSSSSSFSVRDESLVTAQFQNLSHPPAVTNPLHLNYVASYIDTSTVTVVYPPRTCQPFSFYGKNVDVTSTPYRFADDNNQTPLDVIGSKGKSIDEDEQNLSPTREKIIIDLDSDESEDKQEDDKEDEDNIINIQYSDPIIPSEKVLDDTNQEADGMTRNLPCQKDGPYRCPKCTMVFHSSQVFAVHSSFHYRIESRDVRKKRYSARSKSKKKLVVLQPEGETSLVPEDFRLAREGEGGVKNLNEGSDSSVTHKRKRGRPKKLEAETINDMLLQKEGNIVNEGKQEAEAEGVVDAKEKKHENEVQKEEVKGGVHGAPETL